MQVNKSIIDVSDKILLKLSNTTNEIGYDMLRHDHVGTDEEILSAVQLLHKYVSHIVIYTPLKADQIVDFKLVVPMYKRADLEVLLQNGGIERVIQETEARALRAQEADNLDRASKKTSIVSPNIANAVAIISLLVAAGSLLLAYLQYKKCN